MRIQKLIAGLAFISALAATSLPARADATLFKIGTTAIAFEPADGYCPLNKSMDFDRKWLQVQIKSNEAYNQVLGAFARCDELTKLRSGQNVNMSSWIIVLSPFTQPGKAAPLPDYSRQKALDELAGEFRKGVKIDQDAINSAVNKSFEETLQQSLDKPIEISGNGAPNFLGANERAVYAGLKMNVKTGAEDQWVGAVMGMTLVKQYLVSVNYYRPITGPDTLNQLLSETEKMMDRTVAASDN